MERIIMNIATKNESNYLPGNAYITYNKKLAKKDKNFSRFTNIADIKRLKFITSAFQKYLPVNASILDIGCGNGNISMHLGEFGFKVHGIDISPKAVAVAKQENKLPNVTFEVMDAEDLLFSKTKYDGIVCSEVLKHLYLPSELLQVVHEILKDEGVLIVTVPNGLGPRELLVTRPMQFLQRHFKFLWSFLTKFKKLLGYKGTTVQSAADNLSHVQFFTKWSLKKLADKNFFKILKFRNGDFVADVFPFSLLAKRIKSLQKLDCQIADLLPYPFTSSFFSIWTKK